MSKEGFALISRVALIAVMILATALMRTLVGPSRRRGFVMGIGTLGGMTAGVALAPMTSPSIGRDVSVLCACAGIFAGWAIAWRFARRIPRESM